jgi:hypothetical protein
MILWRTINRGLNGFNDFLFLAYPFSIEFSHRFFVYFVVNYFIVL